MHVLRLTYDQKHTLRTADKKIEALREKFAEAQAALNAISEELNEVREFRRAAAKGMCEAAFGEKTSYAVEESADGEYLAYRYDPPPQVDFGLEQAARLSAMAAQQSPMMGMFGGALQNLFGQR